MIVWRLRSYLAALLVATTVVTFAIVSCTILLVRIPQLTQSLKKDVARDVNEISVLMEIMLGSLESRLELLSQAVQTLPPAEAAQQLESTVGAGQTLHAIYLVSADGKVEAAGMASDAKARLAEAVGSDVSRNPLVLAVQALHSPVWGDKSLSVLSGSVSVGLAVPVGKDRLLLAEVPLSYLLSAFRLAAGKRASSVWLVDRHGEIVADTDEKSHAGNNEVLNLALLLATLKGETVPDTFNFLGREFYPAIAHSSDLDWYFIGGMPAGLENPDIRDILLFVLGGFAGALLVGLLMAPFWASWLTRPLRRIVARAEQITQGAAGGTWPRGFITEFNNLSSDLETMATAQQEREQKTKAIFNASPVPMSVTDAGPHYALLDVNDAWCAAFDRRREEVLGRNALEIDLWQSPNERESMMLQLQTPFATAEAWMLRGDSRPILCRVSRQNALIGDAHLMVWAAMDVTEMHRIDNELRALNADLEVRVERRTEALAQLNGELSSAVASLRETQTELVRSAKMAALGGLVAGVAHELNTPLGNGLMAVSSLGDEIRQFRVGMQEGLRRSALEALLASVEQATSIASRNLHRAADLVTSFKQVAVDQTSSQRRRFELAEVVDEMVASLRPSIARTPYGIVVEVPATGLKLDSYPGALGQAIGNLINNAVLHGFDKRGHGSIRISGARGESGDIVLRVADDGHGIPAALLDRIFDPFVTTKMGRGGTGLGLHITYNAVVNLLGGSLGVHSVEGEGTVFELHLPASAPRPAEPEEA